MDYELVKLGAEFLNISAEEFVKRIGNNVQRGIDDWNKYGFGEYDKFTEANIYGLVSFNDTERMENLMFPIKNVKNLNILDFGCGIGTLGFELSTNNNVDMYDVKGKTNEFAKYSADKLNKNVNFIEYDDIFKKKYDLIITTDVLEHLKEPITVADKLLKQLTPRGLFLTTGLLFSTGPSMPMHLEENMQYRQKFDELMRQVSRIIFFMSTRKETIFLHMVK